MSFKEATPSNCFSLVFLLLNQCFIGYNELKLVMLLMRVVVVISYAPSQERLIVLLKLQIALKTDNAYC